MPAINIEDLSEKDKLKMEVEQLRKEVKLERQPVSEGPSAGPGATAGAGGGRAAPARCRRAAAGPGGQPRAEPGGAEREGPVLAQRGGAGGPAAGRRAPCSPRRLLPRSRSERPCRERQNSSVKGTGAWGVPWPAGRPRAKGGS